MDSSWVESHHWVKSLSFEVSDYLGLRNVVAAKNSRLEWFLPLLEEPDDEAAKSITCHLLTQEIITGTRLKDGADAVLFLKEWLQFTTDCEPQSGQRFADRYRTETTNDVEIVSPQSLAETPEGRAGLAKLIRTFRDSIPGLLISFRMLQVHLASGTTGMRTDDCNLRRMRWETIHSGERAAEPLEMLGHQTALLLPFVNGTIVGHDACDSLDSLWRKLKPQLESAMAWLANPITSNRQFVVDGTQVTGLQAVPQMDLDGEEAAIVALLREVGYRLTTSQILSEFSKRNDVKAESTTKLKLSQLVRRKVLSNRSDSQPRGYGFPEWP